MRMCNYESQKKSAKGSNYKEDDSVLPLYNLVITLCYRVYQTAVYIQYSPCFPGVLTLCGVADDTVAGWSHLDSSHPSSLTSN